MIFDNQEILTSVELKESLKLTSDEFDNLINRGLPYVKIKDSKLFVVESIITFLKRIQEEKKGGN